MELILTFKYKVEPEDGMTEADVIAAASELAVFMDVQAEDGLYSLGSREAHEWSDQDNEYVAAFKDGEIGVELV